MTTNTAAPLSVLFDASHIAYTKGLALVARGGALTADALANPSARLVGVDEAGRGPLLGPVAVAAVILDDAQPINGLNDSKKLSAKKRALLFDEIIKKAVAFTIVFVSPQKIDEINILQATLLGMAQCVKALPIPPSEVLIDGNRNVVMNHPQAANPIPSRAVVGGDALHAQISAASILAKVARDAYMTVLHAQHPNYGIDRHKGYPTKLHLAKLAECGALPEHRRSFSPVARVMNDMSIGLA